MNDLDLDLDLLAEPFPAEDVEWKILAAGIGRQNIWAKAVAFITARAIQSRLDAVCGVNWRIEEPKILVVNGQSAFAVGISIRIDNEWRTRWDVGDATTVEPAKGGFSSALKRAGCAWSIGRYLWSLDSGGTKVEVSETDPAIRGWRFGRLGEKQGGQVFFWREPTLPSWALPQDEGETAEVTETEVNKLKKAWKDKFADDVEDRADLSEGFARFVGALCGSFPASNAACWTREAMAQCVAMIESTTACHGDVTDVPFDEE